MVSTNDPKREILKRIKCLKRITEINIKKYCPKLQIRRRLQDVWYNTALFPLGHRICQKDLRGKTIVMIGATSDIVVEACIKFARLRAERLIIGVRDIEEGRAAKVRIEQEGAREADFCIIYELDVASFPSIERFINQVQNTTERFHAVVLYTDLQQQIDKEHDEIIRSSHGTEMQLQVNVLSTAYLAILFLPLLLETASAEGSPTQLEFVGCERYPENIDFSCLRRSWEKSTLQYLNKYAGRTGAENQYAATKFVQMGIMFQLAKLVDHKKLIIFNAELGHCEQCARKTLNPGTPPKAQSSSMFSSNHTVISPTAEEESRNVVRGLLEGSRVHGQVYRNSGEVLRPPYQYLGNQSGDTLSAFAWLELMAGFRRMRNFRAIKRIMPATDYELEGPRLRDRYPRVNGNVTEYPLSNEDCTRFWGMSLVGILPGGTYDKGLGLMKPYPWEPEPVKSEDKKKRRKHADDGSSDGYDDETGKDSWKGSSLDNGEGPSDWWRMSIPKDNDKQSSLDDGERPFKGWKTGYSIVSGEGTERLYDEECSRGQSQGEMECEGKTNEKMKRYFKHLWQRILDHRLLSNDKGKSIDRTYEVRQFNRNLKCKRIEQWMQAEPIPAADPKRRASLPPSDEWNNNVEELFEEDKVAYSERFATLHTRTKYPLRIGDTDVDLFSDSDTDSEES